jgi:hypothetical protein
MRTRRPNTTVGVAVAAALALASFPAGPARANSPLAGRVLDPEGNPARRASVFVYTAAVRTGTSSLCPSCYPDCGKSAVADQQGRFSIPALSESLLFRVLVVARGWEPVFVERVDPGAGPVEFRLARRRPEKADPHRSLRGRVLDPQGRPVVGATLEPFGFRKDSGKDSYMTRFGGLAGTDPLSVTDERGRFALALGDSGVRWYIRVRARNLAPMQLHEQPAGARPITVRMGYGGSVSGRLLRDGKPLAGVGVGLVQTRRAAQFMAYGHDEIATDERGVFTFFNVTPGEDYFVHGKMETLRGFGALDTTRVHVEGETSFERVGDLVVGPGRRVAGRVTLSDGNPVPPGTRLLLSLEHAWDAQSQVLDEEGCFDLRGGPPGSAALVVGVRGYRFARESSGYTETHGMPECEIAGDHGVEGLVLVLEPGRIQPVRVGAPGRP